MPSVTGDASNRQSFSKTIDEALIVAEEKLLPRSLYRVIRLALQQLNGCCICLRLFIQAAKRRGQCRKSSISGVRLPRRPSSKLHGNVIFTEREMRPRTNVVKAP